MGAVDVVPGVSGGTVALLLGIYRRLVMQIRVGTRLGVSLLTGRLADARLHLGQLDLVLLGGLLAGIALAVVLLAGLMGRLIDDYPVQVAAAFFGLVAGSVVALRGRVSNWRSPATVTAALLSAGIAFVLLGLRGDEVANPPLPVFFLAGALAVCAMILPGISGALILVLVGLYGEVIDAVRDFELATIGLLALGAVLGLALFSNLLGRLLERHYEVTLAALLGLMAGSLRVLWPWPATPSEAGDTVLSGFENADLAAPIAAEVPLAAVLACGGFVLVVALMQLAKNATSPQENL